MISTDSERAPAPRKSETQLSPNTYPPCGVLQQLMAATERDYLIHPQSVLVRWGVQGNAAADFLASLGHNNYYFILTTPSFSDTRFIVRVHS